MPDTGYCSLEAASIEGAYMSVVVEGVALREPEDAEGLSTFRLLAADPPHEPLEIGDLDPRRELAVLVQGLRGSARLGTQRPYFVVTETWRLDTPWYELSEVAGRTSSTFDLVPGLTGEPETVSFRGRGTPEPRYLRYRTGDIWLEPIAADDEAARQSATWRIVAPLTSRTD